VLETFPPESYRRLNSLMKRGKGHHAPGPCAIPGCTRLRFPDPYIDTEKRVYTNGRPLFVWDHCHAHDYVRGSLCRCHNGDMRWLDARIAEADQETELMAHWLRCPSCKAGGWEPWLTEQEADGLVARRALLAIGADGRLPQWLQGERDLRWFQERLEWLS